MKHTTNLNLKKPDYTDPVDIQDLNSNMDIIDVQLNDKADKTYVDNKVKTDVPVGAKFTDTVYSHPASHPASMITQDANNRFVTDAEKVTWNGKSNFSGNYNDLTSKPTIPTSTNQLINNSGFITINDVPNEITVGGIKPTDGSMWYEVI